MAGDQSGTVELLVQWVDEGEQDATWELEEEIHPLKLLICTIFLRLRSVIDKVKCMRDGYGHLLLGW